MTVKLLSAAAGVAMIASMAQAVPPRSQPDPSVHQIRAITEKYKDVAVAEAEGYVPASPCETAAMMGKDPALGAMGVHYARPDLLKLTAFEPRVDGVGTHTDFNQPAVLVYEPQADGSMKLVAVENLVFKAAWDAENGGRRPNFRGRLYNYMADDPATELDEAHGFMPHYDLHVWVHEPNPNGLYAQYNPNVTCEHAPGMGDH
ncbi:hypothetical protein [Sphingomicrobium aestuariivivum]|uniref:hypothetical protein n=1 Tax=Sphingomicrobium aestuariivivum TaxID=1582356 RepID=UPI001FD67657|nr:hypothetical protein [Sphingomicrobium aestuariivivum]MCJ8189938.1 hypothetical protein [Sphingomicrobium aestuariivivum]